MPKKRKRRMGDVPQAAAEIAVERCYEEYGPESLRRACVRGVRMTVTESGRATPMDGRKRRR